MRQSVLIYNPKSGRQRSRRMLSEVVEILEGADFAVEPLATAGPSDATHLARTAAANGAEVAFALGGDGTLREVAAGLLGTSTALGPLPAGTANVLTLAFELPRDARAVARRLAVAPVREIDVGLLGEMPFLMMVSAGLDAAVMRSQHAGLKKLLGRAAMGFAAFGGLLTYGFPEITVAIGDRRETATLVVAANIPFYGGPYRMAPAADFRDGLLDLVLFRGRGRRAVLGFAKDLLRGRHAERSDVSIERVEALEILAPPELAVQIDGDVPAIAPPLAVRVAPEKLKVLLPEAIPS